MGATHDSNTPPGSPRAADAGVEAHTAADPGLRHDLVDANHILFHQGVVDAFGHVSVRHDGNPERFLYAAIYHARPDEGQRIGNSIVRTHVS